LRLFEDRNINLDVPQFRQLVPTTENIARVISELVNEYWESCISGVSRLSRVHVQETDRNGFEIWVASEAANADSQREKEKVVV
jgi:6-pyruvoyl-tetrahydropterin synthase